MSIGFVEKCCALWRCLRKPMSFRRRLILGITGLHFVLMSALVLDLLNRQHGFLHQQAGNYAGSLASTLAVSSKSWVMARDVVGLQEVTDSVASQADVSYVMVLTPDLRVLAHSNPERLGMYVTDSVSRRLVGQSGELVPLVRSHDLEDFAAPILAGHKLIGWARVGIKQNQIKATLVRGLMQGVFYIAFGSLVAYVFARLMAGWLAQGLARLTDAFARVGNGERGLRLEIDKDDEIGKLARDFNRMVGSLENSEQKLQLLATTDFLTGLDNRRCFMQNMHAELSRLQRETSRQTAVLLLDLDHFKKVNDTHGHIAGDAVLRHITRLIRENLRKMDFAGRLGGEEFILLLPDTDLEGGVSFAERLRRNIEETSTEWEGIQIPVTVSIGVSLLCTDDVIPETAIKRADTALYTAKNAGRNRVEVLEC